MAPHAILALAALALMAATAQTDHEPLDHAESVMGCITVGYGPPPYAGVGNCDRLRAAVYVNGTVVGWHLP